MSQEDKETQQHVDDILQQCSLASVADQPVGSISLGAAALPDDRYGFGFEPKIILVDEPAAGLVEHERQTLAELIRTIRKRGTAVLIIEHHMALIMALCDRIVVLNFGSKIAEGSPAEISRTGQ